MKRNSFYDSTDSESSSSDDDEDSAENEARLRRGKIIKEGYLWKRVRMKTMLEHVLFK